MLPPDHIAALIDLRVCELRELAAWTAVEYWRLRPRPTLAELAALRKERLPPVFELMPGAWHLRPR